MSETKEPCGKCGHAIAMHTRKVHDKGDAPWSGDKRGGDIEAGAAADQAGCTAPGCKCNGWRTVMPKK